MKQLNKNGHNNLTAKVEIKRLIDNCLISLNEIKKITKNLLNSLEDEDFDKIEVLFLTRGEELERLSEKEQRLDKELTARPDGADSGELKNYIYRRNEVIEHIRKRDKEIDKTIRLFRTEVLTEIKELNRGKKMHKRYIDTSAFASGFIDIKE